MKRLPWFLVLVAALAIAAIAYAVWHYPSAGVVPAATGAEAWGQMGDYFGGMLNPILSFFALIALLYTIHQQRQELALTRQELKKTLEEMELAREAQEYSADLLAKQTAMTVTPTLLRELAKEVETLSYRNNLANQATANPQSATRHELEQVGQNVAHALSSAEPGLTGSQRSELETLLNAINNLMALKHAYESNISWVHAALSFPAEKEQITTISTRKRRLRKMTGDNMRRAKEGNP